MAVTGWILIVTLIPTGVQMYIKDITTAAKCIKLAHLMVPLVVRPPNYSAHWKCVPHKTRNRDKTDA